MAVDFASILRNQQKQDSFASQLLKTVAMQIATDAFRGVPESTKQSAIRQNANSEITNEGRYIDNINNYVQNAIASHKSQIASIKTNSKYYNEQDNSVDYDAMNKDIQLLNQNIVKEFDTLFGTKTIDENKKESINYGTYSWIDNLGKENTSNSLMAATHAKNLRGMLQNDIGVVSVDAVSMNSISDAKQDLQKELDVLKRDKKEMRYFTEEGDNKAMQLMNRVLDAINDRKRKGFEVEEDKELIAHRDSIARASLMDVDAAAGIQLAEGVSELPLNIGFDEENMSKEDKKEMVKFTEKFAIGNKQYKLGDIAKEVDRLLKIGGRDNIKQANFIMNNLLQGDLTSFVNAQKKIAINEQLGKNNVNHHIENKSLNSAKANIVAYSDETKMLTNEGVLLNNLQRASTGKKPKFNSFVLAELSILSKMEPTRRMTSQTKDTDVYDENMLSLGEYSNAMLKLFVVGSGKGNKINDEDKFIKDREGKTYNFGGKGGHIDIFSMPGKEKVKLLMEDMVVTDQIAPGLKGLLAQETDAAFHSVLTLHESDNKLSQFTGDDDNISLEFTEHKAIRGFARVLASKYDNVSNIDKSRKRVEVLDKLIDKDAEKNNKKDDIKPETKKKDLLKDVGNKRIDLSKIETQEQSALGAGRKLLDLQQELENLESSNPDFSSVYRNLQELEDMQKEAGDFYVDKYDEGQPSDMFESVAWNQSLGYEKARDSLDAERDILRDVYKSAEDKKLIGGMFDKWSNTLGDPHVEGQAILNDIEQNGDKSKFYHGDFLLASKRLKEQRAETNEILKPLLDNVKEDRKPMFTTARDRLTAGSLADLVSSTDLGLGLSSPSQLEEKGLTDFMTGKDRLNADIASLMKKLDLGNASNKDLKNDFANLDALIESAKGTYEGSDYFKNTGKQAIDVLNMLRNQNVNIASK